MHSVHDNSREDKKFNISCREISYRVVNLNPTCYWSGRFYFLFNLFPNKPWILRVRSTSLLKTLWEKEKLLVTSNFSFSRSIFYPFGHLSTIFIKFKIVVCKLFQFGRVKKLSFGKGLKAFSYGILFPPSTTFQLFDFSTFQLFDFSPLTFSGLKVEVLLTIVM